MSILELACEEQEKLGHRTGICARLLYIDLNEIKPLTHYHFAAYPESCPATMGLARLLQGTCSQPEAPTLASVPYEIPLRLFVRLIPEP